MRSPTGRNASSPEAQSLGGVRRQHWPLASIDFSEIEARTIMIETTLASKMRKMHAERAEAGLSNAALGDDWLELAQKLEDATRGFYEQTVTPQQLLGHWARARRRWCDVTGEELI